METIRNPLEWAADQASHATHYAASTAQTVRGDRSSESRMAIRRIEVGDLAGVLRRGLDDFAACRTDVIFACLVYPIIGLVLARFFFHYDLLPLLFPLISGFALIGPVAAVGLYDMSRQREQGGRPSWRAALGLLRTPSFGAILVLGLALLVVFAFWMLAAQLIYNATLGPKPPASLGVFLSDVFTTGQGWTMTILGTGVGFVFACVVLATSVISFPLLVDRDVGLVRAVSASIRAVRTNPLPVAVWGLIVAGALVLGTIPLFLGLIFVMPVLGHATWHLYRRMVVH